MSLAFADDIATQIWETQMNIAESITQQMRVTFLRYVLQ